ncbi:MAG: amylo-alpha-1,6-glucosidase [Trueperaceae bacterium]|nr:amylo-alpha-1,6-glucosidase [Trueperaceae bacterium]
MDFRHNVVLKEHYTFFVGGAEAGADGGEHGLYNRDTRILSRYAWRFLSGSEGRFQALVIDSPRPDTLHAHHALIAGPSQLVAVRRTLHACANGLDDELVIENTSLDRQSISVELDVVADFGDLFEARGWHAIERAAPIGHVEATAVEFRHRASDGLEIAVRVTFDALAAARPDGGDWELSLAPGECVTLCAEVRVDNPLDTPPHDPISYDAWRSGFSSDDLAHGVVARAVDDLRGLLLFTEHGPVPAAGIPWFVAAFGRDALLSAHMLLPLAPEVAAGTLRYLAHHQGRRVDAFRAEEPGKIMHELRFGELTRMGRVPHGPYYGTVDATPLFVSLVDAYRRATGDMELVRSLRPAWEAALAWIDDYGDLDGDGFVEFTPAPPGEGLNVQSWKDSGDSMSHADGTLAAGALAVSEVQGYVYAAFCAAADLLEAEADAEGAERWRARATTLAARFHDAFWLDDLGTYAMALDGAKRPLRVQNSDAGQLLWTGIVPEHAAPRLVATLLSPALASGWGIRTLGAEEVRYNPVSYHNGSVWPHDTALIAGGFERYGFTSEAASLGDALFDLARAQPDGRLPELVAGYTRDDRAPVPYPVACRPQAWDAAALLYLLTLRRRPPKRALVAAFP